MSYICDRCGKKAKLFVKRSCIYLCKKCYQIFIKFDEVE